MNLYPGSITFLLYFERELSEIRIEHQARPTRRAADAPPARRYPPIWYCTVHICFRNLVSTAYIPRNRFANASAFAPRRRTIPLRAPRPIRSLSSPTRARRPILTAWSCLDISQISIYAKNC